MGGGQSHAELMFESAQRPLVGLRVDPVVTRSEVLEAADVLNDAVFLVVSLLDQEAVVLNRTRGCCGWSGIETDLSLCLNPVERSEEQQGSERLGRMS